MSLPALLVFTALLAYLTPACGAEPAVTPEPLRSPQPLTTLCPDCEFREGAVIRGPRTNRQIALVFTGHQYAEGANTILSELARHQAKASFFLTGAFLSDTNLATITRRIVRAGHYLGPHSDAHLLYCPWDGPKKSLVSRDEFRADLERNLAKIQGFGVPRPQIRFFLPPFEHYNQEIANWTREMGMVLVNFSPGTRSNADYTGEADKNFVSSERIFQSIFAKEKAEGLNGFILLLHIGAGPGRSDKFHHRFGELLRELRARDYRFVTLDQWIE